MKWIKLAGIIGIVFLVVGFGLFLYSFISGLSQSNDDYSFEENNSGMSNGLIIAILVFSLVLFFFFIFGFVNVSKGVNSKFLKVSSWLFIGSVFLLVIFFLILSSSSSGTYDSSLDGLDSGVFDQAFADFNADIPGDNSVFTGNAVTDVLDFSSGGTSMLWLLVISFLFFIVSVNLFFVSIAELNKVIAYSRPSAFFGTFSFNSFSLMLGLAPLIALVLLFTSGNFLITLLSNLPYLLMLVTVFFMTLFLFDASKKFEQGPLTNQGYRQSYPANR